jgi:hypothetical protein
MPGPPPAALGDWSDRGLCVGMDPDDFFPSHGDPGTGARRACSACTVRSDCLDYATDADEIGIWGGLDRDERRNLKRRRRRANAAAQPVSASPGGST